MLSDTLSARNQEAVKRFCRACESAFNDTHSENGIGTLGERTLHKVLKFYYEPRALCHEIKIGGYVADIVNENGITEIQTRSFFPLRDKLAAFLPIHSVRVVYPVAKTKWLIWVNPETGEATKKRKSPKCGGPWEIFRELYRIKPMLNNPHLSLTVILMDMEEYRTLNGWSADRKKGSVRQERIPLSLQDEINVDTTADYQKLMPEGLPPLFTSRDFKQASGLSLSVAQSALNVLVHVGAVEKQGKSGRLITYQRARKSFPSY